MFVLERNLFYKGYAVITTVNSIQIGSKPTLELIYNTIKHEFDNYEYVQTVEYIVKNINLYQNPPSPNTFIANKKSMVDILIKKTINIINNIIVIADDIYTNINFFDLDFLINKININDQSIIDCLKKIEIASFLEQKKEAKQAFDAVNWLSPSFFSKKKEQAKQAFDAIIFEIPNNIINIIKTIYYTNNHHLINNYNNLLN